MINGHPSNPPAPFAESMSEQDIQGLKEGQKILLEMFHVFDRICRRHNITYWCTGGTLIGAVSSNQASTPHKLGFLPHDGDIDVGMMAKDFPRFVNALDTELLSNLWLQSVETDKHYTNTSFYRHVHSV
eukprot:gene11818-25444_t